MIKAGIIGGAGYTAGELIRLLINHPDVQLMWVNNRVYIIDDGATPKVTTSARESSSFDW